MLNKAIRQSGAIEGQQRCDKANPCGEQAAKPDGDARFNQFAAAEQVGAKHRNIRFISHRERSNVSLGSQSIGHVPLQGVHHIARICMRDVDFHQGVVDCK